MISLDDYAGYDAIGLAELVKRGDVTPLELVEAAIACIEQHNPQINAVIHKMYEQARERAQGSLPDGPFKGVPFLLKDLLSAYAGEPMRSGSRFHKDVVPTEHSMMTQRYLDAGLIVLGKTNTPEYGITAVTEPELFGTTNNPWDVSRTSGGSSGGSAAAVASRFVPMAHAGDGLGSIRIPASCCGLFGLKPTRARTPKGPGVGDSISGLVIDHVISRTVRDSAALLDVTAGPAVGDPYAAPEQKRPFLDEVSTPPGQLRIAFSTEAFNGTTVHPDCVQAVAETAVLCEQLGHIVEEAAPIINAEQFLSAFTAMWAAGCAWGITGIAHQSGIKPRAEMYEPVTWGLYEMAQQISAADYLLAVQANQMMARQVAHFFLDYDLFLTPTITEPPLPLGSFNSTADNPMAGFDRAISVAAFTPLANATGQPAMSIPLHWNADGLPVGVQFNGRFGDEAMLFRLAGQLEAARPWKDRRPPVSA